MRNIQSIFIISGDGNTLFTHEKFAQGTDEIKQMLFQKFVLAFQNFVSEMGSDETNIVLGNSKIASLYDENIEVFFVLKSDLNAQSKEMRTMLKKIQLIVRKKLNEKKVSIQNLDPFFFEDLRIIINRILEPKTNVQKFIEILGF
ncbi:MAG: hypothetical protein ACTSR8_12685 [Promethearchaeota archaeon]